VLLLLLGDDEEMCDASATRMIPIDAKLTRCRSRQVVVDIAEPPLVVASLIMTIVDGCDPRLLCVCDVEALS